jgi:hypothetical protein
MQRSSYVGSFENIDAIVNSRHDLRTFVENNLKLILLNETYFNKLR